MIKKTKMKKILISILILFSILITPVFAQYYADTKIVVENTGEVSLESKTNFEKLNTTTNPTHEFTSKEKENWLLNISFEETFDDYIYELTLPQNSEINYIKTTPTFRITEENNKIKIIGTGDNQKFQIIIQYKINNTKQIYTENKNIIWFVIIFLVITSIILRLFGYKLKKESKQNQTLNKKEEENKQKIDISILPQRQKEIIEILKSKEKITQKELEIIMQIPKSSISRNLKTLEIKGIIKKETAGQVNYISLRYN